VWKGSFVAAGPSFVGVVEEWSTGVEGAGSRIGRVVSGAELFTTAAIVAGNLHGEKVKTEAWKLLVSRVASAEISRKGKI